MIVGRLMKEVDMKVMKYTDIPAQTMQSPELKDVNIRVVIGPDDGAPNFVMRLFEVGPGGYTPQHAHDWEHEVFIKAGQGVVKTKNGEVPVSEGSVIFIPPGEPHQFRNTGSSVLEFICLVPQGAG